MSELQRTLSDLHVALAQADRLSRDDREQLESALEDIRRALGHGDTLEGAAVRLEAGHPGVAGAIRAVLDALAKAGI
jgi:hypothetical protein